MPELPILIVAIFLTWIVLKLAKLAVKLILFVVTVILIAGALWYVFVR
jgi:hypothetical protein